MQLCKTEQEIDFYKLIDTNFYVDVRFILSPLFESPLTFFFLISIILQFIWNYQKYWPVSSSYGGGSRPWDQSGTNTDVPVNNSVQKAERWRQVLPLKSSTILWYSLWEVFCLTRRSRICNFFIIYFLMRNSVLCPVYLQKHVTVTVKVSFLYLMILISLQNTANHWRCYQYLMDILGNVHRSFFLIPTCCLCEWDTFAWWCT